MQMANLDSASQELFRRTDDECFDSLPELWQHCHQDRELSVELWHRPQDLLPMSDMTLSINADPGYVLNDWSFSQLCRMAGVSKDTINRLSPVTASAALQETLPRSDKPVQLLTANDRVRSIHGVSYTRLWNADLLSMLREYATDFQPPQKAMTGGTGLYCGQQDMFCFLIDPTGWTEIDGEAFAPGFFVWNSEVGRRSLGIQTFWFQAVCRNHIVWDAIDVVEFTRKHTANVRDGLSEIRRIVEALVEKRDARRDGFAKVIQKAMETRLGADAEEVGKALAKHGISRSLVKKALETAEQQGRFTIFALVDAMTRATQELRFAGDRTECDQKVSSLLALAA